MKLAQTKASKPPGGHCPGKWRDVRNNLLAGLLLVLLLSSWAATPEATHIQSEVLTRTTLSWDGKTLPEYPEGQPEVTILRITIPPHTKLPMHKHPVINAGVLLKGELTVVAENGKTQNVKSGEAIVEMVNQWHYGRNDGDEPAEILVFYAGTPGTPITVTKPQQGTTLQHGK